MLVVQTPQISGVLERANLVLAIVFAKCLRLGHFKSAMFIRFRRIAILREIIMEFTIELQFRI